MLNHEIRVPFLNLGFGNNLVKQKVLQNFNEILDSNWFILGKFCKEFEINYANFNDVQYCIGVGNGLDALVISLKSLNIGPGDEVIIPSNTFIATALAVSYVGAKPVLVEPSDVTYNIQAKNILECINKKTKAIIPVHLYGQSCEMTEIMELAATHGIKVIEDNAQSQGATCNGKLTGTFGEINATSFYPGKNLGAMGDAGAITTNSEDLSKKALLFRNYGSLKKYVHEVKGQNSRLDEIQAAVLIEKLKLLKKWNVERQQIANIYSRELSSIGDIKLPQTQNGVTHVYHLYVIRTEKRDQLRSYLEKNGIETLIHYPVPIHLQGSYSELGYKKGSLPVAEMISNTCLSLPLYPGLTRENQEFVIAMVKRFFNGK